MEQNINLVHDGIIKNYEVDFRNKDIKLYIEPSTSFITNLEYTKRNRKEIVLIFKETFAYKFMHESMVLENILLDIDISNILFFIKRHKDELQESKKYGWPMLFNSIEELEEKLKREKYNYYDIYSSLGMSGWIVAKNITLEY